MAEMPDKKPQFAEMLTGELVDRGAALNAKIKTDAEQLDHYKTALTWKARQKLKDNLKASPFDARPEAQNTVEFNGLTSAHASIQFKYRVSLPVSLAKEFRKQLPESTANAVIEKEVKFSLNADELIRLLADSSVKGDTRRTLEKLLQTATANTKVNSAITFSAKKKE